MEVVPQLVEDVSLKRSRVQLEGGGEAIKVIGVGSNVSITPTLVSGTKIADYSIDETPGTLYAPNGGVGQAYPESTGGEIFNYYGTDSDKNVASGDYSTAMGQSNTASGDYSCAIGGYNKAAGSFSFTVGSGNEANYGATTAIGQANTCNGSESIAIGHDNTVLEKCYAFGIHNTCLTDNKVIVGNNLRTITNNEMTMYGQYNYNTAALTNPTVIIASGSENNPVNAIECNTTTTKVRNNLQLASDSTEVNAITAPPDPNNVTQQDKTLVTLGYLSSTFSNMMIDQDIEDAPAWLKPQIRNGGYYELSETTYKAIICFFSVPAASLYFSLTMTQDSSAVNIQYYTFYDGSNPQLFKFYLSLPGDELHNESGVDVTLIRLIYIF